MFKFQINRQPSSLLSMLICLTILFIVAQISLFYTHYKVSDLVDSLVNTSIALQILHTVILLPMIKYIMLQIIAYVLFVGWIWFIAVSVSEWFKLSKNTTYWMGIIFWCLACVTLLTLNYKYYPDSFFAKELMNFNLFKHYHHIFFIFSLSVFFIATSIAYLNYFWCKRYRIIGTLLLLITVVMMAGALYERKYHPVVIQKTHAQPNIIFIGLDSLRPDFIHYYGAQEIRTPNIDLFLKNSLHFTQAYTPLARTFPAWISILTAKYPKHHYARNNLVNPKNVLMNDTLVKHLQQAGYETIYATDEKRFSNITADYGFNRVLGPQMGVNDFLLGGLSDFPMSNLLVNLPLGKFLFPYNYANRAAAITYEPNSFLQLVREGLTNLPDKPIFLSVHLCLSHWPFTWAHQHELKKFYLPDQYRESVEGVDKQLGALMQILQARGLLENSLVVLLSDHGTAIGLPGDRLIEKKKYVGDLKDYKLVPVARLSSASENTTNYARDYTINTAYGQGTNVLSLPQSHVLLAFKRIGGGLPSRAISETSSLVDIAPTILDFLNLPAMANVDGISLLNNINHEPRALFMETGDSLAEIETDKIYIEKVFKHEIGIYTLDTKNGLLMMTTPAEQSVIKNKQLAVMWNGWMLAHFPATMQNKLRSAKVKSKLAFKPYMIPPYFILANLKTGEWTVGLSSDFAKKAPVDELMKRLRDFYGNEVPK